MARKLHPALRSPMICPRWNSDSSRRAVLGGMTGFGRWCAGARVRGRVLRSDWQWCDGLVLVRKIKNDHSLLNLGGWECMYLHPQWNEKNKKNKIKTIEFTEKRAENREQRAVDRSLNTLCSLYLMRTFYAAWRFVCTFLAWLITEGPKVCCHVTHHMNYWTYGDTKHTCICGIYQGCPRSHTFISGKVDKFCLTMRKVQYCIERTSPADMFQFPSSTKYRGLVFIGW